MTRIAVVGGTGYAGSHIVAEAVARGFAVTAVSRTAVEAPAGAENVTGDLSDTELISRLAAEHDVVVLAVPGAGSSPRLPDALPEVLRAVAGQARLGVVGGAGSLRVEPGGPKLVETPDFPEDFLPEATAHDDVLAQLREADAGLRWFYLSPAAVFGAWAPGERTGTYRTADEVLITDQQGESTISGADYAIAFVDEIERPAHENARFHVAN
ncbi:NAD(P)-dependent oxidoreductase [Nesterenkonia sp. F]|uniref:NAD(P)-dependent oxidoreductase n=1 Tax=Nesterenkonia sp. F TaxID=795955 RepID=UPI000255D007|nr:NAD(P)H-binding protein [Nesterenkonia sp. F]